MKMNVYFSDGFTMIAFVDSDGKATRLYFDQDSDAPEGTKCSSCEEADLSPGAKEYFDNVLE